MGRPVDPGLVVHEPFYLCRGAQSVCRRQTRPMIKFPMQGQRGDLFRFLLRTPVEPHDRIPERHSPAVDRDQRFTLRRNDNSFHALPDRIRRYCVKAADQRFKIPFGLKLHDIPFLCVQRIFFRPRRDIL